MRTTLRLPEELAKDARERCQRLGISINALVCVALDAYLAGPSNPAVPVHAEPVQASDADALLSPKERYALERARKKADRRR